MAKKKLPERSEQIKLLTSLKYITEPVKVTTIKRACQAALEAWIKTLPLELQKQAMDETILTGGFIANLFLGLAPNDVDLYFVHPDFALAVAKHYVAQFKDAHKDGLEKDYHISIIEARMNDLPDGTSRVAVFVKSAGVATDKTAKTVPERVVDEGLAAARAILADDGEPDDDESETPAPDYQYFEQVSDPNVATTYLEQLLEKQPAEDNFRVACMTSNAISLGHADPDLLPFQLVMRFQGEPVQIHENFDWVHCTCYYTLAGGLVTPPEALTALLTKELRLVGQTKYPLAALLRSYKFVERGFRRPHAGYVLQLAHSLAQLDWNKLETWREQLLGLDAAYFIEILHKLDEVGKVGDLKGVAGTYLAQLVEEVMQ